MTKHLEGRVENLERQAGVGDQTPRLTFILVKTDGEPQPTPAEWNAAEDKYYKLCGESKTSIPVLNYGDGLIYTEHKGQRVDLGRYAGKAQADPKHSTA